MQDAHHVTRRVRIHGRIGVALEEHAVELAYHLKVEVTGTGYCSSSGTPHPPPPGVRMLNTSPASTSSVSFPAR